MAAPRRRWKHLQRIAYQGRGSAKAGEELKGSSTQRNPHSAAGRGEGPSEQEKDTSHL